MDAHPDAPYVLAYDDDPAILGIYAELLAEEGYRVTLAAEPMSDVEEVAALGVDLVVVDLLAGREEVGSGFLARLKAHPATRDLPVLVCSGDHLRLAGMRPWLDAWACAVVEKPFDIEAFVAAVQSCLDGGATRTPDVAA